MDRFFQQKPEATTAPGANNSALANLDCWSIFFGEKRTPETPQEAHRKEAAPSAERRTQTDRTNEWQISERWNSSHVMMLQAKQLVKLADFCQLNNIETDPDKIDLNQQYAFQHPTGRKEHGWRVSKVSGLTVELAYETRIAVKPKQSHAGVLEVMPGVADDHLKQVEKTLSMIPQNVLKVIENAGYKILVTPKITDALPHLQDVAPRGWAGKTFDNSDGTMDEVRKLIVSPDRFKHDGVWLPNERPDVVSHQIGHAIDAIQKNYSSSEEFQKAYIRDINAMPSRDRNHIYQYLTQPGGVGAKEAYACIFGMLLTGPENPNDRAYFEKHFPNVIELLSQKIKELK